MTTMHFFDTQNEANAFCDGVNLVGDIDVSTGTPLFDAVAGKWMVSVTIEEQ